MEAGNRHLSIEELFRQKLENAEVVPGDRVNADLMRKLSRREFLRFNPSKFNIYYLGLILAGVITAGLLLFSEPETEKNSPVEQPEKENAEIIPVGTISTAGGIINKESPDPVVTGASSKSVISKQEISTGEIKTETGRQIVNSPSGVNGPDAKGIVLNENEGQKSLQDGPAGDPPLIVPSAVTGCAPLKIRFSNPAGSYSSYKWSFGDGGMSDNKEPEWIYDVEGEYRVVLNASDEKGKRSTWTAQIKVHAQPTARFEFSPDNAVLPIDEIRFVNYSTGASVYKWEFGDGSSSTESEPVHKYLKFGRYDIRLMAISEHGCSDTLVIKDAFSGSEYYINLPNAFIPNSQGPSGGMYSTKTDETAEIFHPTCSGVRDYQLRIFAAKTGILLFESNDINIGWDGYYKGQLCNPGVYIWKIRGNFSNGEPFTRMGDVTLLKK